MMNEKYNKMSNMEYAFRKKPWYFDSGKLVKTPHLWIKRIVRGEEHESISCDNIKFTENDLLLNVPIPFKQQK